MAPPAGAPQAHPQGPSARHRSQRSRSSPSRAFARARAAQSCGLPVRDDAWRLPHPALRGAQKTQFRPLRLEAHWIRSVRRRARDPQNQYPKSFPYACCGGASSAAGLSVSSVWAVFAALCFRSLPAASGRFCSFVEDQVRADGVRLSFIAPTQHGCRLPFGGHADEMRARAALCSSRQGRPAPLCFSAFAPFSRDRPSTSFILGKGCVKRRRIRLLLCAERSPRCISTTYTCIPRITCSMRWRQFAFTPASATNATCLISVCARNLSVNSYYIRNSYTSVFLLTSVG